MQQITLQIFDEDYADLQAAADRRGMSIEQTAEVMLGHELWQERTR